MKKWILAFTVVALVAVMGGIAVAQGADTPKVSERLWILLDCSSNSRSYWEEIQAVGKSAIRALNPGDRVRIVAVMKRDSRVLLLEQVSNDENIRSEIIQTMTEIQTGSSSNTDLAKGLSVPLAALEKADANKSSVDLVLLLTSGKMEDETAQALLDVYDKLITGGARVVVTGVRDSNPILLLAAARGRLAWRDLDVLDPQQWIFEVRKAAQPTPPPTIQEQKPDKQPSAAAPQSDKGSTSEHSKAVPISPPTPSKTAPEAVPTPPTPEVPPSPPSSVAPAEPAKETSKTAPVLAAGEGSPSQPKKVLELNISITSPEDKTAGAVTAPAAGAAGASSLPQAQGSTAPIQVKVPLPPAQPQPAVTTTPTAAPPWPVSSSPIQEPEKAPAPETMGAPETPVMPAATEPAPSPPARLGRWRYWFIGAPVALLLLIVLGGLAFRDLRRARRATRPTDAATETDQRLSEVVARFNGAERILGRPEALKHFHVGSGASNALRIPEIGVEEQHVLFRRDRAGTWSVRNLSSKPLEANGTPVNPGKTLYDLDFPVAVRLTDRVCFNMFIRPSSHGQESSEVSEPDAVRSATNG